MEADNSLPVQMLRPLSEGELGRFYNVTRKTFQKWLKPFRDKVGIKNGRYYSIKQIRVIVECLGAPLFEDTDNRNKQEKTGTNRH